MIVRRATVDDAPALTDCLRAAYAPFMALGLPPVTEGIAEDIRDLTVWVAELDGAVRGGIVARFADQAHIVNLAVHPNEGGHGVGKTLLNHAQDAAIAQGYDSLHLATHVDMAATRAFYKRGGWAETGQDGKKVYFELDITNKKVVP